MEKIKLNVGNFPVSKGSERLESPVGEPLRQFLHRFMARKEAKTGWRSGALTKGDLRKPSGEALAKPFVSLYTALSEAGYCASTEEAETLLERYAETTPEFGAGKRQGAFRYWKITARDEEGEF